MSTLGVSLIPVIFYNRIPYLNRLQSRWVKWPLRIAFFFGPVNIVAAVTNMSLVKSMQETN